MQNPTAGFAVTPYLSTCVGDCAADLALDPDLSRLLLPGGAPVAAGARLRQPDLAASLRLIAAEGPGALYGGPLGAALTRLGVSVPAAMPDLWSISIARVAPVVPYLLLVLVLAVRPRGLMGTRSA